MVISFGVGVAWINGRKCKNQQQRPASRPSGGPRQGRNPGPEGEGTRGPGDQKGGSRPQRPAPEGRHDHDPAQPDRKAGLPQAGRPTYGNAPPLRGLGIDRPGTKGVAIARERVAGGRLPRGRMPRQGRRSRRPPAPGGWRGMPRGLESEDFGDGVGCFSWDGDCVGR